MLRAGPFKVQLHLTDNGHLCGKRKSIKMYALVKTQSGAVKSCPASAIEPTENTDTCHSLNDEDWHYGDSTYARTQSGNRVVVEPLFFSGKLILWCYFSACNRFI